jgi:hypothetical protein
MEGTVKEEDVAQEESKEKSPDEVEAVEETTPEEPEPVEDNTMTLAEYMASKQKKEETVGREVENEFKGLSAAVKKQEEDFLVMGGGKAKKTKKKKEEEKKKVDVGFRVVSCCFIVFCFRFRFFSRCFLTISFQFFAFTSLNFRLTQTVDVAETVKVDVAEAEEEEEVVTDHGECFGEIQNQFFWNG